MEKTKLPNCPQWLLDADTKNEDVRYDAIGRVEWLSGEFLGGEFLGGEFLGGNFQGGTFWSGTFRGGTFRGGNFRGGTFLGVDISRKPITIYGLAWPVYITQAGAKIGCQAHSVAAWNTLSDSEINAMAPGALAFWHQNKGLILSVLNHEASFLVVEVQK